MRRFRAGALVAVGVLMAGGGSLSRLPAQPASSVSAAEPGRCAEFTRASVPNHVVNIGRATAVAANGEVPAHCLVEGEIDPRIGFGGKAYALGFALALPDAWSGRFIFQGGGGYNGVVRPPLALQSGGPSALARGFAVISTDSGHKGGTPAFLEDQQATVDFAHASVGTVTMVGKSLVQSYYQKPAHHTYFAGCSNGGREAMVAAQRYPLMFDGIVAGDPGMRSENTRLTSMWAATVYNRAAPKDASGRPEPGKLYSDADRKLVLGRLLERCDGLDGMKDGLIFNYAGCRFDPTELICKAAKNDTCLTRTQAEAIKTAVAGPKTRAGLPFYAPYAYDTTILTQRYMLAGAQEGRFSAPNTATEFDVDRAAASVAADGAWTLAATAGWTNYSTFFGHGGKLIFTSGLSDPAFSSIDLADYYARLVKDNGGSDAARASSRLFMVPGRGHCGGGDVTLTQFDTLDALVTWVEQGRAPDRIEAGLSSAPDSKRPLCPWPAYAYYRGQGDPKDSASYECRQ